MRAGAAELANELTFLSKSMLDTQESSAYQLIDPIEDRKYIEL